MASPQIKLVPIPQPWKPAQATERIREMARAEPFTPHYKKHAKERLDERDLLMGDVLYLLRNGFVYKDPEPSTKEGYYKYEIECKTPNSGAREVRAVVIPDPSSCQIKIVTVMWADESI